MVGLTPEGEDFKFFILVIDYDNVNNVGALELLTGDSLNVGHVEVPARGQRSKERCHVRGTLEALAGLLVTLAVVDLQVNH